MNNRQRFNAVMNYETSDRIPLIHFGFTKELLDRWLAEKRFTDTEFLGGKEEYEIWLKLGSKLGFDFPFEVYVEAKNYLVPPFEKQIVKTFEDGSMHIRNGNGVVELFVPGTDSIPSEIDHLLKDRDNWKKHFKPRLQWNLDRLPCDYENKIKFWNSAEDFPCKINLGSAIGEIRNWVGIVNLSYMVFDDPDLIQEIVDTVAEISYRNTEALLLSGLRPDIAHYWEDICYKNGSLLQPQWFGDVVVKHYKKISSLLKRYGCQLISVDCDGKIDDLLPYWLDNGVNVMFPIEMGTWNPDFKIWREKCGKDLRGIGGINKHVLSQSRSAIDAEIERIKPCVSGGGFIPCPDHRLPPDTEWDLVLYYTEKMRKEFNWR